MGPRAHSVPKGDHHLRLAVRAGLGLGFGA